MQSFLADQDIVVSFDLTEVDLTITGLEYRVEDQDGVALVPRTTLSYTPGAQEASVTVTAVNNTVPASATAGARTVYLYVTGTGSAAGETMLRASYRVVAEDRLPVPEASFQTLAGAEMVALDMINVDAFINASDSHKIAALMSAHERLAALPLSLGSDNYRYRAGWGLVDDKFNLSDITASEWETLDPTFKAVIKRAQVIEASELLSAAADQFTELRAQGVTSVTIGESSRTWTNARVANLGVSHRAMRTLSKYLSGRRIARA